MAPDKCGAQYYREFLIPSAIRDPGPYLPGIVCEKDHILASLYTTAGSTWGPNRNRQQETIRPTSLQCSIPLPPENRSHVAQTGFQLAV